MSTRDLFEINGVISTDKTVLQNLQELATAAGCWLTYDVSSNRWAVIINQAGTSVASFNDSNIIGGINVSGKGMNELYNSALIEFPHKDLRDQNDEIIVKIADGDKFASEVDNVLNIRVDTINNPAQAQYIAGIELKQNRLDKIIEFRTDYSMIGLKAGDIIDVTNEQYGYTEKLFRIITLDEDDGDVLAISITALEYSADVYDTSDLVREVRDRKTGIPPLVTNQAVATSDNLATATSNASGASDLLTPAAIAAALALGNGVLFDFLKTTSDTSKAGASATNPGTTIPSYATTSVDLSEAYVLGEFNDFAGEPTTGGDFVGDSSAKPTATFTVPVDFNTLMFIVDCPYADYFMFPEEFAFDIIGNVPVITSINTTFISDLGIDVVTGIDYTEEQFVSDVTEIYNNRRVFAYIPMKCTVYLDGTPVYFKETGKDVSTQTFVFSNAPAGEYTLEFEPVAYYDFNGGTTNNLVYHAYYSSLGLGGISVSVLAFKN